jgi:RNase adaptor protein for sRNA GlmZ degradation
LFNNHLRENATCDCKKGIENAEHYFFQCTLFLNQRIVLFRETRRYHPLSVNSLLRGKEVLSEEDNLKIFISVQKFIHDTRRF